MSNTNDDQKEEERMLRRQMRRLNSYAHLFPSQPDYPPIEDHGLIGNMHTTALVSTQACIDWFCYPYFDSPSIFASILDAEKGGFFKVSVAVAAHNENLFTNATNVRHKQVYVPDSNVLISRFLSETGVGQVADFMPAKSDELITAMSKFKHMKQWQWLLREIEVVRGRMYFRVECVPSFNYGRDSHEVDVLKHGARFRSKDLEMVLSSTRPLNWRKHSKYPGGVECEFALNHGEREGLVFRESYHGKSEDPFREDPPECHPDLTGHPLSLEQSNLLKECTLKYWRNWINQCTYKGRWREMVTRSALTLKLLTFEPTGAIVAAPTTSLPEGVGSGRNWDYRFSWIRDSSFTLYAFMKLGFHEEAAKFIKWVEQRCNEITEETGKLQIMYGMRGEKKLVEVILEHLEGYKGSGPVRIGNGAFDQLQLDICGELMDTIYMADKYAYPISYDLWKHIRALITFVEKNWQKKDEGIWEVRGGKQHFVYSKVMCWVAVDRAVRLATKHSLPCTLNEWVKLRDTIYEEIQEKGFNKERNAFMQAYDNTTLDASVLMMPLVHFQSPMDPRILGTVDAILENVENGGLMSNNLVFRYDVSQTDDGLSGQEEGTFSICTFWLVEVLARIGQFDKKYLEKSRWIMEQMLGYANHLGLYSEEIGTCGEALGNFPQAFTHLALISAAVTLDKVLDSKSNTE
jgi:GH15 family glucan-1,4-alpha-glucosidase